MDGHKYIIMTGRSTPEWFGKTPDSKVPPRVRDRIFERENGICHLSKRKIATGEAWDLDHRIALCNGGEHREANLFPALIEKHREKTKEDVAEKSKIARIRKKHLGLRPPPTLSHPTLKRRMDGRVVYRETGELVK